MKRWLFPAMVLLAGWLATGFYRVQGNEHAVVRRAGRVVRTDTGNVALRGSGLHYDAPWPFSRVDRIRLNEVRSVSVGNVVLDGDQLDAMLLPMGSDAEVQFLTGDHNIVNLQVLAQYRISGERPDDYLYQAGSVERRLKLIIESSASDLVARSGVDFVHPLGLGQLRDLLTVHVRQRTDDLRFGVEIESVGIEAVSPPVRVKADFLDVANARNDRQKYINTAQAYEEQRIATGRSEALSIIDRAETIRQQTVQESRAVAASFVKIVDQFERDETEGIQSRTASRSMAMQRLYVETMQNVLSQVADKVFLEGGKPIDLTIFREKRK